MLTTRSGQLGLFEADNLYLGYVGEDTFYGFLASQRCELFCDEEFAEFYSPDKGRPSVAPSLLATALLLQAHDRVSDEEAKGRADYDLRWKVALGVEVDDRPFAKSTLQLFRAQLVLQEKMRAVFQQSLEYARQSGYMKKHQLRVVLDTTYILGRGAVKDTYNLLADSMVQLLRVLAEVTGSEVARWAAQHGYGRYLASSIKGEAEVDWDDEGSRLEFLQGIVRDGGRLLGLAEEALASTSEEDEGRKRIQHAAELMRQLISQDVERPEGKVALKEGVARDRVVSVHDPEMRHGRKSSSKRFDGHKAAIAVDADSQLITAVEVLAGNAPDNERALELIEDSEKNTGMEASEAIGDCAYGDGKTRQAFADANRKLVAKVASRGRRDQIGKDTFRLDLDEMSCTCPEGQTTRTLMPQGHWQDRAGKRHQRHAFLFDADLCTVCRVHAECVKAKGHKGRTIQLHPQERLLQEARALQDSPAFQEYRKLRQTAEHRLARLVQLGTRQARYFGRKKTLFQLLMAATVANLTLVGTKKGHMRCKDSRSHSFFAPFLALVEPIWGHRPHLEFTLASVSPQKPAFRLSF
ncbi:MAG: IS1182 family transposase [Bacteroidota bacterium]